MWVQSFSYHQKTRVNTPVTTIRGSHLDAKARPGGKVCDSDLDGEVFGRAPSEAVIYALHHHGAGRATAVEVEAEGVDQNHFALHLVHHH